MIAEEWRDVPGYEGFYQVSSFGAVRSLDRVVFGAKKQTVKGRLLSERDNGNGYKFVTLWSGGRQENMYVHRLVLLAFSGPSEKGLSACHNDGDRSNNRLSNLRWDTTIANHADKKIHGTLRQGGRCYQAKLSDIDIQSIRRMLSAGFEQKEVAKLFGISQPSVSDIKHGRTWKHVPEYTK